MVTNRDVGERIEILARRRAHTHASERVRIRVQEVIRDIKRRAEELPNAAPSSIYAAATQSIVDDEIVANLPKRANIIRNVNRIQATRRSRNRLMNRS